MHCAEIISTGAFPYQTSGLVSRAKDKFRPKERGRWQIASRLRGAGGRSKESDALTWCCLIQCLTGVALRFSFQTIFSGKFILGGKLSNFSFH
jgi:hypothetical protein